MVMVVSLPPTWGADGVEIEYCCSLMTMIELDREYPSVTLCR